MHIKSFLLFIAALITVVGLALAADNFSINTFGGTRTIIDAVDNAGVYTLRTIPAGPNAATTTGIVPVVTTTAASSKVLKVSAGNLYGFTATSGASAGYLLVYDLTAAPSNGIVTPIDCVSIPASTSVGLNYSPPLVMATGIVIAFSTTGCFSQTLSATAFISGEAK